MTSVCPICGKPEWHGSKYARAGTYLSETGCHSGVMMDDDEHAEGWQKDVIYPPCPQNPKRCMKCNGYGEIDDGECPGCEGSGWIGKPEWPVLAPDDQP